MKKIIVLSILSVFVLSSLSLAAVKKTAPKAKPAAPAAVQPVSAPQPASTGMGITVSPKVMAGSGVGSFFGVGVEVAMPIMQSVDGMAELYYTPGSGWSVMGLGANGIYRFAPMENMPFNLYAGGGLIYNMINMSTFVQGSGSASAFGFQVLGGADYPIPGMGTAFGQIKYAMANYTFNYNIGGFPFTATGNSGGFALEGGWRFKF